MAERFSEFATWLAHRVGPHKAAITINRHYRFFRALDKCWGGVPEYRSLLRRYGAHELRRVRLPMIWFASVGLLDVDEVAKRESVERRRIADALRSTPRSDPQRSLVFGYYRALRAKLDAGKTSFRSVRLALTPAVALLRSAGSSISQRALDQYLRSHPGQRSALTGFVNYLRRSESLNLVMPRPDREAARRRRRRELEKTLIAMIRAPEVHNDLGRVWREHALAYFHDLPKKVISNLPEDSVRWHEGGAATVTVAGKDYWVPPVPERRLTDNGEDIL